MMQILGTAGLSLLCDEARPPDPSNPRGYFEYAPVRHTRSSTEWLTAAPGRAVKVIHSLVEFLPRDRPYRVVLMRRPIREIVASQNRMLERLGKERPALADERVEAILEAQLESLIELLDSQPCFRWHEVDYVRLVDQPRKTLLSLLKFLEIKPELSRLVEQVDPLMRHEAP